MNEHDLERLFDRMAKNWPAEIVARTKVKDFTGGLINGKTVANHEAKGEGPPRIKIGRMVGYPKRPFVDWMKSRAVMI